MTGVTNLRLALRLAGQGLAWASKHSGVPAVVIAAIALVLLYRLAKRSAKFVAQVSLVLIVLAVLTKLGLLRF